MCKAISAEESSGNIFADLGLENADELFARAQIGYYVLQRQADRNLKRREITALLGIDQPEVSHLMNGHFSRLTIDKLLGFLKYLDCEVTIHIAPNTDGEPYQDVKTSM